MKSDLEQLQFMYQQWCQGNDDYNLRWLDFIRQASFHMNRDTKEIFSILQHTHWFEWHI